MGWEELRSSSHLQLETNLELIFVIANRRRR